MPRYALDALDLGGLNLFYVLDHDTDAAAGTKARAFPTEAFPHWAVVGQFDRSGLQTTEPDDTIRNLLLLVADDFALDAGFLPLGVNDKAVAEFMVGTPSTE